MAQKTNRTQFDIMHPLFKALEESELTVTERMLIIGLYRFMDGNGSCFPSYKAIERTTALSRPTISKCLKRLVDTGWISYTKGSNSAQQANEYQLNLEKLGIMQPEPAPVVSINQPRKAQYIANDGAVFDYPTAMHAHNAKLQG